MMNVMHIRNGKKIYVIYAVGLFLVCSIGLVMKNFNDKIVLMSESVQTYQEMIDQQSEQMKTITREKERFKRELEEEKEENEETVSELKTSLQTLEEKDKLEITRLEKEVMDLQEDFHDLEQQKSKLEAKYKTLSKANAAAVADIEHLKAENKNLRVELHEATTSKTSEQLQLRDGMAKISVERDKYRDQYTALFKQHQQSLDSIQLLQNEKDRLQEQIRGIQRLSGGAAAAAGAGSSSQVPEVHQVQPESSSPASVLTSSSRPMAVPQVMEEPGQGQDIQPSSSTSSSLGGHGASPALAQAPPPVVGGAQPAVVPLLGQGGGPGVGQAPPVQVQSTPVKQVKALPPLQVRSMAHPARHQVPDIQSGLYHPQPGVYPLGGGQAVYQLGSHGGHQGGQAVYHGGGGGLYPAQGYHGGYRGELKPIQPQRGVVRSQGANIDEDELAAPLPPIAPRSKHVPMQGGWYPGHQGQYVQQAKYGGGLVGGWPQQGQQAWKEAPGFGIQGNGLEEEEEEEEDTEEERRYGDQQGVDRGRDF